MKIFGLQFFRGPHIRFYWWPRRLTIKSNPAIYSWLGFNFDMPWTQYRDRKSGYCTLWTAIQWFITHRRHMKPELRRTIPWRQTWREIYDYITSEEHDGGSGRI